MLQRTLPAGFIAPCLPTKTDQLPSGSQWLHEIKHDGFRIIARKTGAHVGTMVSVVGVNGYAPGIRDRSGRDPMRHSRRVGVGIERCALYATDNQESEPRGIKNPLFRCVIVSVLAFCHWSERTPLGPSCGANFQGGYIMLKILTALAASLALERLSGLDALSITTLMPRFGGAFLSGTSSRVANCPAAEASSANTLCKAPLGRGLFFWTPTSASAASLAARFGSSYVSMTTRVFRPSQAAIL